MLLDRLNMIRRNGMAILLIEHNHGVRDVCVGQRCCDA